MLRPVGAILVDGNEVNRLLHVAGRCVLADGVLHGRERVAGAARGVDQENRQRSDRVLAFKDNLVDRKAVVTDKEWFYRKVNRVALPIHAVGLKLDAGEPLGVGIGDVQPADLIGVLAPYDRTGRGGDHDGRDKHDEGDECDRKATRFSVSGVSHETSPFR